MKQIVAVLRGGPSSQYAQSLETGGYVLKHLPERYTGRDIFISTDGAWHVDGLQVKPQQALERADIVWNALQGEYGEDGKVQRILFNSGIPYTGSNPVASALSMNKKLSKKAFADEGIRTPMHIIVEQGDDLNNHAQHIFFNFHMPVVIKPTNSGNSIGVSIARARGDIIPQLEEALRISNTVLVEAYIPGKDIVCIVVENLRDQEHYVPIPIEIRYAAGHDIFHTALKQDKSMIHHEAMHLIDKVKNEIAHIAKAAHRVLGLSHYSRSDMRITPTNKIYLLETNTTPILHDQSATIQSLRSVGIEPKAFIDHMISLALKGN